MSTFVKKVIRASAGTGKTYRLSLEYIALLLRCRGEGIHFSEILVITFTKKATAEIRDRIFNHMLSLITGDVDALSLQSNLAELLGRSWQHSDREWLRQIYQEMLTNKSQLQISTIDAFINRLFKSIISPYIGLSSYSINSRMDPRYYAALYAYALEPGNMEIVKALFERSKKRTLPDYERLIRDLLRERWLFHFIEQYGSGHHPSPEVAEASLAAFHDQLAVVFDRFGAYLQKDKPGAGAREVMLTAYFELLFGENDPGADWLQQSKARYFDREFVRDNHKLLLKDLRFWSGSSLMRKADDKELAVELKEMLETARQALADFLYHSDFLLEEAELAQIAAMILHKYDELRFRDQVFGYDDIAWYTFKYLYDPELSLVEEDSVTNAFYEILANRVRFLLIDEFQDTSLLQFKILWPMIREVISGEGVRNYGGVIVVGDEKQSIYGWRGGERDLLPAMHALLDGAESLRLETSYRSSPVIIDFVNGLFGGASLQKRLTDRSLAWPYAPCRTALADQPGGIFVCFRTYGDADEEGELASLRDACDELVRKELHPLLLQGTIQPRDTAILARENRDLRTIADILDELKIDYVLESSHSVLEHRAIKPVMYLLRYLATLDFAELLKFLRSDFILTGGSELKEILLTYRAATEDPLSAPLWQKLASRLPHLDSLRRCAALLDAAAGLDLLSLCKRIFEDFAVIRLFPQENDSKNITFFLELVARFCHTQREFPPTPVGFIRYCALHQDDEGWQQLGLEEVDAIRLLTVHKAKGLEFGSVFLFWPLSGRREESDKLHCYVQHDLFFRRIEQHALTYNYARVLQESSKRDLVEREEARECIEELNAFYVAVTRAKRNLGIYISGKSSKGVEGLLAKAAERDTLPAAELILIALHELLDASGRLSSLRPDGVDARWGEWLPLHSGPPVWNEIETTLLAGYLDPERLPWYRPNLEHLEKERFLDYRSVYINKRRVDRGNVVHYYLSFIEFDTPAARKRAGQRALGDFGNLLPAAEIRRLIEKVERFLTEKAEFFSAGAWSRVFTEQTLYAPDGREQRIDRMLLSEARKEILIIDFKTGESHEQDQLDDYIRTVSALPAVRRCGYHVRGLFLEVGME
jgi:ATP-dependent exoDNAse (exonuclease V) beta subunit